MAKGEKMKILVIDDTEKNRESAKELATEHEVVVVSGWDESYTLLRPEYTGTSKTVPWSFQKVGFDVVLTDLMMPCTTARGFDFNFVGKSIPYGFAIAMFAIASGIPVAIASSGDNDNRHSDPILWALCGGGDDYSLGGLHMPVPLSGKFLLLAGKECPLLEPSRAKDWKKVLERLLKQ